MERTTPTLIEVERLLAEVASWDDKDIEALPKLYRDRAREYRRLLNDGEG